MRSTMERLRTWDFRTQTYTSKDRSLTRAFGELNRLKDKLGLSDAVVEKAATFIEKHRKKC